MGKMSSLDSMIWPGALLGVFAGWMVQPFVRWVVCCIMKPYKEDDSMLPLGKLPVDVENRLRSLEEGYKLFKVRVERTERALIAAGLGVPEYDLGVTSVEVSEEEDSNCWHNAVAPNKCVGITWLDHQVSKDASASSVNACDDSLTIVEQTNPCMLSEDGSNLPIDLGMEESSSDTPAQVGEEARKQPDMISDSLPIIEQTNPWTLSKDGSNLPVDLNVDELSSNTKMLVPPQQGLGCRQQQYVLDDTLPTSEQTNSRTLHVDESRLPVDLTMKVPSSIPIREGVGVCRQQEDSLHHSLTTIEQMEPCMPSEGGSGFLADLSAELLFSDMRTFAPAQGGEADCRQQQDVLNDSLLPFEQNNPWTHCEDGSCLQIDPSVEVLLSDTRTESGTQQEILDDSWPTKEETIPLLPSEDENCFPVDLGMQILASDTATILAAQESEDAGRKQQDVLHDSLPTGELTYSFTLSDDENSWLLDLGEEALPSDLGNIALQEGEDAPWQQRQEVDEFSLTTAAKFQTRIPPPQPLRKMSNALSSATVTPDTVYRTPDTAHRTPDTAPRNIKKSNLKSGCPLSTSQRRGTKINCQPAKRATCISEPVEQGGRQMFDKNTLRARHQELFASAIQKNRRQQLLHVDDDASLAHKASLPNGNPALPVNPIRVSVRKRPLFEKESQDDFDVVTVCPEKFASTELVLHNCLFQADLKTPFIQHLGFEYDHVFPETTDNSDVYRITASEMVKQCREGGLSTLFMFGQTGSGKTHTMSGIEELAARDLFEGANLDGPWLTLQFVELRGNHCFDLLAPGPKLKRPELRLREQPDGSYDVDGSYQAVPKSPEELQAMMRLAHSRRATSVTDANAVSSRSHAVCTISMSSSQGKLMLVDCAGTERKKDSMHHTKERQLEGAEINASLHALKECIRYKSARQNVPSHAYRGSSLTKVLADSFRHADRSHVSILCTVSPCASDTEHTLSTLRTGASLSCYQGICERENKECLKGAMNANQAPRELHPRQWPPERVQAWFGEVANGQFREARAALPSNFTGQMFVRLTEPRCVQLCGENKQRGRSLYEHLRRELQRHS